MCYNCGIWVLATAGRVVKAFIALILYGVIYTVAEAISAAMGIPHGITCYAILLFTAAVVFILFYTGWFTRQKAAPWQERGRQDTQRVQRNDPYQRRQQRQKGQTVLQPSRQQGQESYFRQSQKNDVPAAQKSWLYASYVLLAVVPAACLVFGIAAKSYVFDFNLFVLAMCAAVLEELFFRGFFIEWLREQMSFSLLVSIGLSALAFAVLHLANAPTAGAGAALLQALFALAIGIALGCAYTMYPRIAPCIGLHALINAASFAGVSNVLVDIGEIVIAALVAIYLLMTMQKQAQRTVSRRRGNAPQDGRMRRSR